ncbi:DUF6607 family protein [Kordiimonas aquimaris]|uniref:DUF6607 family protein n=1 Tax=Kordiimonas aquimaris TaxID=707591 RepID=UPI0021D3A1BE|nr:DUF6607 family protein [Kordiimonas aquimaris]
MTLGNTVNRAWAQTADQATDQTTGRARQAAGEATTRAKPHTLMQTVKRAIGITAIAFGMTACGATSQNSGGLVATSAPQAKTASTIEQASIEQAAIKRDRQAILAMVGDFDVTFDFRETVSFQQGYTPKDPYVTGATEIVRVIEDRGDFISLQHILLVGKERNTPIKHWRQDWSYEPTSITRFIGANGWDVVALNPADTKGQWAQFVYQVDDGPRYAALGIWEYTSGAPEWAGHKAWRPLPRRDATKRSDYHAIEAVNRHAITPNGWVHEQDNTKLILDGANPQILVREVGVNTYVRTNSVDATAALEYWDKTKGFWQAIRAEWTRLETGTDAFGLTVQGEPEKVYMQILGVASAVADGSMSERDGIKDALDIIKTYTETDLAPVHVRLSVADSQDTGE